MTDVPTVPTREDVRASVAGILNRPVEEIADDVSLVSLGLKSLQLIQLINQWRRAGLRLQFRDLAADPTIDGWVARLAEAGVG